MEFGIKWGISRIDGIAMGFVMENIANVSDKKFCIDSIQKHIELFGEAPQTFGFDLCKALRLLNQLEVLPA